MKQRKEQIEKDILAACERSNRNRSDVKVVAITKQVSVSTAKAAFQEGICHLGENRLEGLQQKQTAMEENVQWHFVGNVQSRKVRELVNNIDYLHSVDRLSLVKEIQKRAEQPVKCFIQVNVSGEQSKSGFTPDEAEAFIDAIQQYDKVHVIGLMTMAPFTEDTELIRSVFRSLRELRDRIAAKKLPHAPCTELSMGMSNDFEIAIEEGATFVRIGTALVGTESEGDE